MANSFNLPSNLYQPQIQTMANITNVNLPQNLHNNNNFMYNPNLAQIQNMQMQLAALQQSTNQMPMLTEQEERQMKNDLCSKLGISNSSTDNSSFDNNSNNPNSSNSRNSNSSSKSKSSFEKLSTTTKIAPSSNLPAQSLPQTKSIIIETANGKRKRSYGHILDPAERKRIRNREVAKSSRESKKNYTRELEEGFKHQQLENQRLQAENNNLRVSFQNLVRATQFNHNELSTILGSEYQLMFNVPIADPKYDNYNVQNEISQLNCRSMQHYGKLEPSEVNPSNSETGSNSCGTSTTGSLDQPQSSLSATSSSSENNQSAPPSITKNLDETLSNHMPVNKKMKPNITVEQDSNGVANKFISYNNDCHGTVVVNDGESTNQNQAILQQNNNQQNNFFSQNFPPSTNNQILGSNLLMSQMNNYLLFQNLAAQNQMVQNQMMGLTSNDQNINAVNNNTNNNSNDPINRIKRNHSSGMGSVVSGSIDNNNNNRFSPVNYGNVVNSNQQN